MAGCSIVLLMLIIIPLILMILVMVLGFVGGAILMALICTVLIIVLSVNGIFKKYQNSEIRWQRIASALGQAVLIILLIVSIISASIGAYFLYNSFNLFG